MKILPSNSSFSRFLVNSILSAKKQILENILRFYYLFDYEVFEKLNHSTIYMELIILKALWELGL